MRACHLPLFALDGHAVEFHGDREGDELLDGDLLAAGREAGNVRLGVAAFASAHDAEDEWTADIRRRGAIALNWENGFGRTEGPADARLGDALAAVEGPVLEIAAGPGGGNMPAVLRRNPRASLLVNDIAAPILDLWRDFLTARGLAPCASFVAFDARAMPLRDGCVEAVSSLGGFGEVGGEDAGVREAARVLAPGGRVCAIEMVVNAADWSRLPADVRAGWESHIPGLTRGWASLLEAAGLRVEQREAVPGRALDPEEGGLPKEAARHGVTLRVDFEYVMAAR